MYVRVREIICCFNLFPPLFHSPPCVFITLWLVSCSPPKFLSSAFSLHCSLFLITCLWPCCGSKVRVRLLHSRGGMSERKASHWYDQAVVHLVVHVLGTVVWNFKLIPTTGVFYPVLWFFFTLLLSLGHFEICTKDSWPLKWQAGIIDHGCLLPYKPILLVLMHLFVLWVYSGIHCNLLYVLIDCVTNICNPS